MSLFVGNVASRIVYTSQNSFKVDGGMLAPTFYNEGQTAVLINDLEVLPGESYAVDVPNVVIQSPFSIKFKSEAGKTDRVRISYVTVSGPLVNPLTGAAYSPAELTALKATC
ncbi:hypothetical protein [Robiginitalea biformata]|uniref:Uncharacterized protein n=1 Tax=Robiginitalea biformata (strain ATCC BAA-864 / DSM 15991 / KCTC 12146 / HTCC2501) TaxID=313596 RepID=A4CKN5_ROBBH|nr:hypothetical protein [Robiginitalea biformata]EAR15434.1 hypothetical protein RB2501_13939 [Robiginitalea biformata HTCC2501]